MKIEERIQTYINSVCAESVKAEHRTDDVKYQYCIIDHNVIFSVCSKYRRVRSRILYRLAKNFERNFHEYRIRLIPSNIEDERMMNWDPTYDHTHGFSVYMLKYGIDPNYSFAYWDFFGEPATIQCFMNDKLISKDAGKKGTKVVNKHFENFIDLTDDEAYGIHTKTWDKFKEDYKKIYGCDPYKVEQTYHN